MDDESKQLLKQDLFVQGLLLKWQEKVLPSSAATLRMPYKKLGSWRSKTNSLHLSKTTPATESSGRRSTTTSTFENWSQPCHQCGSCRHRVLDCPQKRPPSETPGCSVPLTRQQWSLVMDDVSHSLRSLPLSMSAVIKHTRIGRKQNLLEWCMTIALQLIL